MPYICKVPDLVYEYEFNISAPMSKVKAEKSCQDWNGELLKLKTKADYLEMLHVYRNLKFQTEKLPLLYWSDNKKGKTFFKLKKGK